MPDPHEQHGPRSLIGLDLFHRPPLWLSLTFTVLTIGLVAYIRLFIFKDEVISLGYGLPLILALWHRDRTQLYFMAGTFAVLSYLKFFVELPHPTQIDHINFVMGEVTIWTTTIALHIVLRSQGRIEMQSRQLSEANLELEARNEELAANDEEISRQNSELQSQAEELERQHEELRQQAEEMEQQTVELHTANDELARRERGLETLLESARWLRSDLSEADIMSAVCHAAVQVMEHGVVAAAVVQEKEGQVVLRGHFGFGVHGGLKHDCDYKNSFASLIIEKGQTGFIVDLHDRPDLDIVQPMVGKPFRSVLAAPLFLEGRVVGAVEVYAQDPREWTASEFKVIEWLAAQCALALQAIEYQQEVLIKRREAEEASIQKTRFLAAVSHDVRTPANAISLMADLIEQSAANPGAIHELPVLARDLKSSARALVDLVSDVLDLARLDTGKLDLQISEFSLPQLMHHEIRQFERLAAEKKILLNTHPGCDDLHVRTDRMKLARVLANLLGNAVKFTDAGSVDLRCHRLPAGGAAVTVADSGVGIPHDALARIFDEFYQIRNPERDRNKGSGLGLAICKRLVETLGCILSVESTVGVGTIFTLKIPENLLVPAPQTQSPATSHSAPDHAVVLPELDIPLAGVKILLVEDHEVTRKAAARLLASRGAIVLQAATGRETYDILARQQPHAVLLDLMLPDVDGTEILRYLASRRQPSLKCILAVSGDVRDARIAEVKALGADDLIPKPLDIQKLMNALTSRFHPAPARPVAVQHAAVANAPAK